MTDEIRLSSGQMARLKGGVLEVVGGKRPQYRLTVEHRDGGQLIARSPNQAALLGFLGDVERLHYSLQALELEGLP